MATVTTPTLTAAPRGRRSANPTVTVFTSIDGIAQRLRDLSSSTSSCCWDDLVEIREDAALSGFGGTVHFDPSKLSSQSLRQLRAAEILVTEPAVLASLLVFLQQQQQQPVVLPSLRWVQSTYAGVDPLLELLRNNNLENDASFPFTVTRFAGRFGPPMAEWCLARIVAHERDFAASAADQRERAWAGRRHLVTSYRYLSDLTLTVLGCGDIGHCIARAAKAFGMRVVGFVRTERRREEGSSSSTGEAVDLYTTDLAEALAQADYIVSVLPATPETVGLLSGDHALRPAQAKSPVWINVGRGSVLDEASLLAALDKNYLSAAILDVFETEPLPAASGLWDHPRVTVSPHVSGLTRGQDVPQLVLQNYERYCRGDRELLYAVDWRKGY